MRIQLLSTVFATGAIATISLGAINAPSAATQPSEVRASSAAAMQGNMDSYEAARLAKQASFGPSTALIEEISSSKSAGAWIDKQFTLNESTYRDLASKPVPTSYCLSQPMDRQSDCSRENFSATPMQMRFYSNAINNKDQLRQRVAFALSQIIVTSDMNVRSSTGLATFNQILIENSFGNYKDILREVTLNPYMGDYLDMVDSNKAAPNENYARELLQLFSIGTILLNQDGTPQLDSQGSMIPAYTNGDVIEIARALTGWTFTRLNGAAITDKLRLDYSKPLIIVPSRFDNGSKNFLGKSVAANASQEDNVEAVVDAAFNHPNTAPFVSKRLIQQLTVANPTPAYVERVAAAFADNGAGVRGDMKAVLRAVYLDKEARTTSQQPGKLKEPVLLATSLARAIGATTDGYAFFTRDAGMGQAPFRAPSVFNYYPYDFPLPLAQGVVSPASKSLTAPTVSARHNFVFDWTIAADASRSEFKPGLGLTGTTLDWASWEANGVDDGKTIDRINLVLLNGTMTTAQRQSLAAAMAAIKNNDPALQARKRAQVAMYIVASSPLFQVDR